MSKHGSKKKRYKHPAAKKVGLPPGTLVAAPDAQCSSLKVIAYRADAFIEPVINRPEEVTRLLAEWPMVWVHVEGVGDPEIIGALGDVFGLHKLALEDVLTTRQRAKVERYDNYYFIVARMAEQVDSLQTEQFGMFLGPNFVLSFEERAGSFFGPLRDRIRQNVGRLRASGSDYLAYALLDTIIDHYYPVLDFIDNALETIEDVVFDRPTKKTVKRIHLLRRDLLTLRRATWPLREVLNTLMRESGPIFRVETQLYLRDCYDHVIQIVDLNETYREIAASLLEVYLSKISNYLNEVMRVLTVITTIFIPLSFFAGLYGMNFNTEASPLNMPELNWYYGYPVLLLLMALITVGMLIFFRRKGWIGKEPEEEGEEEPTVDGRPPAAMQNEK